MTDRVRLKHLKRELKAWKAAAQTWKEAYTRLIDAIEKNSFVNKRKLKTK